MRFCVYLDRKRRFRVIPSHGAPNHRSRYRIRGCGWGYWNCSGGIMKRYVWIRNLIWTISAAMGSLGVAQAQITVTEARIGCLDSPTANEGNLTRFVAQACNGQFSCSYKAPDEKTYRSWGVQAHTK